MRPLVEILLATKDGADFLPEQLASFEVQTDVDWNVVAGDDGSTDATRDLLHAFAARTGRLALRDGPQRGAAANFLALLDASGPEGLTAFADQDDIWFSDRLARAARMLGPWDNAAPRLYASRTVLVGPRGGVLGASSRSRCAPGFRNALVENILPGNTMVMNAAARDLLRRSLSAARDVPFHDWWAYALLTGAGAEVIRDDRPGLFYRQHVRNLIGAHRGARASLARIRAVAGGVYGDWLRRNVDALGRSTHLLAPVARDDLAHFTRAFSRSVGSRLAALISSRARRQTRAASLCVFCAAVLGRL